MTKLYPGLTYEARGLSALEPTALWPVSYRMDGTGPLGRLEKPA